MYASVDFKTKKALKEAVEAGQEIHVFQPNDMFGRTEAVAAAARTTVSVEGPHYLKPHRWYATVEVEHGRIVKVK